MDAGSHGWQRVSLVNFWHRELKLSCNSKGVNFIDLDVTPRLNDCIIICKVC